MGNNTGHTAIEGYREGDSRDSPDAGGSDRMSVQEAAGWKDDKSSLADYEHPVGEFYWAMYVPLNIKFSLYNGLHSHNIKSLFFSLNFSFLQLFMCTHVALLS